MQNYRNLLATAALVTLAGTLLPASAAPSSGSADLVRGTLDGHRYQTGGAGMDQRAQMARNAKGYDLRLSASEGRRHSALAGAAMDVYDARGKDVLSLKHAGPLTDVQLPAGRYRVVARAGDMTREGKVHVTPGHMAHLNLNFPHEPSAG
jgi:hypothetical protein